MAAPFAPKRVTVAAAHAAAAAVVQRDEAEAIAWRRRLGIAAVVVSDPGAAYDAAIAVLPPALLGLDLETSVPGRVLPEPRRKKDGTPAAPRKSDDDRAGLDPRRARIATVQLYGGGDAAFIFCGAARDRLLADPWLSAPERRFVAHNSSFETSFLAAAGVILPRPIECSMLAAELVWGSGQSLATVCGRVLGHTPPKDFGLSDWSGPLSPGQIAYAASDAVLAYVLGAGFLARLQRGKLDRAYRLRRDAVPHVVAMQAHGLGFDRDAHAQWLAGHEATAAAAEARYVELTGAAPPCGWVQTAALLERTLTKVERLGWPRTAGGGLSTERLHLKQLLHRPEIAALLDLRASQTLLNAQFGRKLPGFICPETERLHASYRINGAITGRFSCSRPNLQQLPSQRYPSHRKAIVAAPGNLQISGDWSLLEMRDAAWLSGDPVMIAALAAGRDLHRETAAEIARVHYDQVTPAQRNAAKPVNFGMLYGASAETIAANAFDDYGIVIPVSQAAAARDRAFAKYAVLRRWQQRTAEHYQETGLVPIATGRSIAASWLKTGELSFTQCLNFPVQGIGGDAMLRAITLAGERLPGALVASIHDELLLEVPERDAAEAAAVLADVMTQAFAETFPGAPLNGVVETGIGRNWHEAKP